MKTKVLVIDDEFLVRETVENILEDAGYEAIIATGGVEGLKLLEEHSPSIVISDIIMPDKDGIEIIQDIRKIKADVKIIAISGSTFGQQYLEAAKELGADAILRKPFLPFELIAVLEKIEEA